MIMVLRYTYVHHAGNNKFFVISKVGKKATSISSQHIFAPPVYDSTVDLFESMNFLYIIFNVG